MNNHTPGPWKHLPDEFNREEAKTACGSIYGGEYYIATIEDAPEWRVNARLIAAAPALLTALQTLVGDVQEYERVNKLAPNPGHRDCWQSLTNAHAAIAKATE